MNNKKVTILFILFMTTILLGIVGFTIAYFTSSTDFDNEFYTAVYQTKATETFTSPENWMPGDTIPKTLTIKNEGNVDVKARVCISEEWTSNNNESLPLIFDDVRMALINFDNAEDWTQECNCYVYNEVLEPNDTTSSFISGVTFNKDAKASLNCTTTNNNGTTTKTCTSVGDGYDNATYKLTLKVDTVQTGKLWDDDVISVIGKTGGQLVTGDEISIAGEHFYVINSNEDKTTLLAKYNLLVGEIFTEEYSHVKTLNSEDVGFGLQNENAKGFFTEDIFDETGVDIVGVVPFSSTNYWDSSVCQNTDDYLDCTGTRGLLDEFSNAFNISGKYNYEPIYPYVYRSNIGNTIAPEIEYDDPGVYVQNNGYTIAYYVENYVKKLKELGAPSEISGRLLRREELSRLGYDEESNSSSSVPSWVYTTAYWLGTATDNTNISVIYDSIYNYTFEDISLFGVRPVIEIPTNYIKNFNCKVPSNYSNYVYTANLVISDSSVQYSSLDYYNFANESPVIIGTAIPINTKKYGSLSDAALGFNNYFNNNNNILNFALKHKIKNNIVTDSFIEFVITDEMVRSGQAQTAGTYTLNYTIDSSKRDSVYNLNKQTLLNAFGSNYCFESTGIFDFTNYNYYTGFSCTNDFFQVGISKDNSYSIAQKVYNNNNYYCNLDSTIGCYCSTTPAIG